MSPVQVVAEARHVDAQELELRREIRAYKAGTVPGEALGEHVGHLVAGRHESVVDAPVHHALADCVNSHVARLERVVHLEPGEMMDIPAKPASTKIKVRPLKNLKAMI